jgi:hypothetical protein
LNNLGILVKDDSSRRSEAEELFQEALGIRRQLAKDNSAVYLPDVANTLAAFSFAYLNWQEPKQALIYLEESATLFEPFAKYLPGVFGEKYAYILQLIDRIRTQ